MQNPWLSSSLIVLLFVLLTGGLLALSRRRRIHPELLRKLLHAGMGLGTLCFPWVFESPWPVFVLAGLFTVVLVLARNWKPLRNQLGGILYEIGRESYGEIIFPISIALVFLLSEGDPLLFCIPVLAMSLADSVAALVGVQYGTQRYQLNNATKTLEGSVAFFFVTFLITVLPFFVWTNLPPSELLVLALSVGMWATGLEAMCRKGLDNLVVPLAVCLLLQAFQAGGGRPLAASFSGAMLFIAIVVLKAKSTHSSWKEVPTRSPLCEELESPQQGELTS